MKRLLSLLLVIAMLFSVCAMFTACNSSGTSDDDKKKEEKEEEVEPTLVFNGLKIVLPEDFEEEIRNDSSDSSYVRLVGDTYSVSITCSAIGGEFEGMDATELRDYYLEMLDPENEDNEIGKHDSGKKNGTPYLYAVMSDKSTAMVMAFYVDNDYYWTVHISPTPNEDEEFNIDEMIKLITGWKYKKPDPNEEGAQPGPNPGGEEDEYPDGSYPVETEPTEDAQIGTVPTEPAVEAEGQLLYSGSGISVFLTDYIDGPDSKTFDFAVQNENDTAVIFYSDRFTINGSASLDGYFSFFVEAGSVATGSLTFSSEELALYGIDIIGNLSFPFNIQDPISSEYFILGDVICLATDYDGYQHDVYRDGEVIFEQDGLRVLLQQIDITNDYCATLYIENNTSNTLAIYFRNVIINGCFLHTADTPQSLVQPGAYSMLRMDLSGASDMGIAVIENMFMDICANYAWSDVQTEAFCSQLSYVPGNIEYVDVFQGELRPIYSTDAFSLYWYDYSESDDCLIFRLYIVNDSNDPTAVFLENPVINGLNCSGTFSAMLPANSHAIFNLYVYYMDHSNFIDFDALTSLEYQLRLLTFPYDEEALYAQVSFPLN